LIHCFNRTYSILLHALYLLRPSSLLVKQTHVKQRERERDRIFFTSKPDARKAERERERDRIFFTSKADARKAERERERGLIFFTSKADARKADGRSK